jgi:hypothetical protein
MTNKQRKVTADDLIKYQWFEEILDEAPLPDVVVEKLSDIDSWKLSDWFGKVLAKVHKRAFRLGYEKGLRGGHEKENPQVNRTRLTLIK